MTGASPRRRRKRLKRLVLSVPERQYTESGTGTAENQRLLGCWRTKPCRGCVLSELLSADMLTRSSR